MQVRIRAAVIAAKPDKRMAALQTQIIGKELQVGISSFGSWMLGVGTIIGSMAWLFHAPMIALGGTLPSIAAFAVGAITSIPLAITLAELSRLVPSAGGPYMYKYLAFKSLFPRAGEFLGFSSGWLFWIALVAGYACMANGLANLLATSFWGETASAPAWFPPLCIASMFVSATVLNSFTVSKVASINSAFTLMKFALAGGFVALVLSSGNFDFARVLQTVTPTGQGDFLSNLSRVLVFGIAAYSGLELTACASSETSHAQRTVPRAIVCTLVSVAAIYIVMSIAVSGSAPLACTANGANAIVAGTQLPATCPGMASYLGGPAIGAVFTFGVIASIIGCAIGGLLSCARIVFAIAKTGFFPPQLAALNADKAPICALWFQCLVMTAVSIAANLLSRYGLVPDAYTFLAEVFAFLYSFLAIFYGVSLIVLRKASTEPKPKLPVIAAFAVMVIYTALAFICVSPIHQITGAILLLLGAPLYLFNARQRKHADTPGRI